MIQALCTEIKLRKGEFLNETIQTIYFGGGTPSICSTQEINRILDTVYTNFKVANHPEITLEANPDDLTLEKIKALSQTKINRLSIGVQSFYEADLQLMNREHNAQEALRSITIAKEFFNNISIDLIYGIPGMHNSQWQENLHKAIDLNIPHISSYALTVEPNTALEKHIQKGISPPVSDASAEAHYQILVKTLEKAGYINYEFSNFGKEGFFSQNNTAYWKGKKYLGIGPSAHSFNGKERSWNIANNSLYIKGIQNNTRSYESETLNTTNQYNEYIMTGLRTIWGVSLTKITSDYGSNYTEHLLKMIQKHLKNKHLILSENPVSYTHLTLPTICSV